MIEKYCSEETKAIKTGLYIIFAIIVFSIFYTIRINSIEYKKQEPSYIVYAKFGRTDGIQIGDNVQLAGIKIGKVLAASIGKNFNGILTLEIKKGIKIPDDSSASIVSDGVLGAKYIEIEPGGSEDYIEPKGEFNYTQDAMVLEELMERIIEIGKSKKISKTIKGENIWKSVLLKQ